MRVALVAALAAAWITPAAASPPRLLADPFQDHAVLQRDKPITLWGRAAPGERLTITLGSSSATARADAEGGWRANLPAMKAGGPYRLIVRAASGAEQRVDDMLIGDVWLCSGQSNMMWPVKLALNGVGEAQEASDGAIRMLTVPNDISLVPLDGFRRTASWEVTSPATAGEFSAACYFFARELRKTVKVPVGLVDASWGGSAISAWLSEATLRSLGERKEERAILAERRTDPPAAAMHWGQLWASWWRGRTGDAEGAEPWNAKPDDSWSPVPALISWDKWGIEALAQFDGMLWYRTTVSLTAAQAAQGARLMLGEIDDIDQSFVNGRSVGATAEPGALRDYALAPGTLRAGENVITVNVLDLWGPGGMMGPSENRALRLADGTTIPLDGQWLYRAVPREVGQPPRAPWEAMSGLSTISNGMIAPLGSYGFRGALWYQGESDTDRADGYAKRLGALMADWRARFGQDMSFLIVQLADFGAASAVPVNSGWPRLRDEQRRAVEADGNAALTVTIDIGERTNIHPANKQELGQRLARAARHLVYREAIMPSGPRVVSATRTADKVVVRFRDVERALVSYSAARPIAFELCDASGTQCRFVDARAEGDRVTLDAGSGPAQRVRYCWADSPVCNLYDGSGLPAGPFEVAVE